MKATKTQKAYFGKYYKENRERIRARQKLYYQEHSEALLAQKRQRYPYDKERIQQYQARNAEKIQQYQLVHREEKLAQAKANNDRLKEAIILFYSKGRGSCEWCNFDDIRALTIDHIGGGGSRHRKQLGGRNFYRWLKEQGYPKGYQVLCMNCQFIKKKEKGENKWQQ